eukprot:3710532-Pleurochrysis_carterae.AAC.1
MLEVSSSSKAWYMTYARSPSIESKSADTSTTCPESCGAQERERESRKRVQRGGRKGDEERSTAKVSADGACGEKGQRNRYEHAGSRRID